MNEQESLDYILDRHLRSVGGDMPEPEARFSRYAISIFRGGIGKTTLAFNLAYEMSQDTSLLVGDVCPQRNLSELLLGEDLAGTQPTIYDALLATVAAGLPAPKPGTLANRISQSCKEFRKGKKSYAIAGSNELFLFASSLYGALGSLSVLDEARRADATASMLLGLRKTLDTEAEAMEADRILIDTSPFFGGATHLAWMAADALIVPVRVDQSSMEALDLTLRMLDEKQMEYHRYRDAAGIDSEPLRIQALAVTHCGWTRTKADTPDHSTQAFVSRIASKITEVPHLFTMSNPLDSVVLLDDFHSAGRISGAFRRPMATLRVGEFVTLEGKRLQVNQSTTRYQRELRVLANLL